MSDQKMQECFEFYYDLKWEQVNDFAQQAWKAAWQASRESLVIELPAENPLGKGSGDCEGGLPSFEQQCAAECNFVIRDCREAIHAAGVKTK